MPAWPVRPKSGHAANAAFMSTRSDLIRSPNAHLSEHVGVVPHFDLHETKRHRWDLETVPDLGGFAAANDLVGKSDVEVREAIGDKFPKHIHHSIVCIGALIAHRESDYWAVDAVGAPHVGERTEKELIVAFCDKIAELSPQ